MPPVSQQFEFWTLISRGTSDIDQVSKIGKLGLIDGNLVIIATKFSFLWPSFSTIFWKYMIQTSYQKFVQSKLVFHYNSFLCKRRCLYLQKSSDSEMFCDQKNLVAMMTKFPLWWPSFSTIFWKYMIQTSYQKFVGSKLVFYSNSFLCKTGCLYLQKYSHSDQVFWSQNIFLSLDFWR